MPAATWRKFLRRVWRAQRTDGYAFLTWFDDDYDWEDRRFEDQAFDIESGRPQGLALPNDGIDVYFTPNLFSEPQRRKQYACRGRWLYADLDEVDPRSLQYLLPTIAWETSPGRYQALWRLSKLLEPRQLAALNQKLTYFTDADRGGWSLTKVLRLPGTTSSKHGFEWEIPLLWQDGDSYTPREVLRVVRDVPTPSDMNGSTGPIRVPRASAQEIRQKYRGKLSASARKLLRAKESHGDRSAVLWKLYNLLLDAGMTPGEVFVLVKPTVWNKYAGQRRENRQLWNEIHKAMVNRPAPTPDDAEDDDDDDEAPTRNGRQLQSYDDFLKRSLPKPRWLVESIWSDKAHGILAGRAKAYKSVISTDLAVSVASGSRFLDHFPVPKQGPVIIIQEENDPGEMQDRLQRIAHSKALTGSLNLRGSQLEISSDKSLPIGLMNNVGFDLTDEDDMEWLEKEIKRIRPALLILDPLYLMTPGADENSAVDMTPILKNLLRFKQKYDVGVLILHHFHKAGTDTRTELERISGTGVFGRWFESALIVERPDPGEPTVRLVPHHRGHSPQGTTYVTFDLGTDSDLHYSVDIVRPKEEAAEQHHKLAAELEIEKMKNGYVMFSTLKDRLNMPAATLKRLLTDHGWVVVKARGGGRGRPRLIAKPIDD